jgi:chemotaxis protein MotB
VAKQRPKKVEEGAPEWMMTFGDLMSQLLTFFILLISFSIFDDVKYNTMKGSLEYSFGVLKGWEQPKMDRVLKPPERPSSDDSQRLGGIGYRLKEYMNNQRISGAVKVNMTPAGLAVVLRSAGEPAMFDSAEADIKSGFMHILDRISEELIGIPNSIRIEGHTDSLPISTERYPSNWELSSARAGSVLRYFEEKGVDRLRLSAAGYGEFRPIASNDTIENRSKNRRVKILILRGTTVSSDESAHSR